VPRRLRTAWPPPFQQRAAALAARLSGLDRRRALQADRVRRLATTAAAIAARLQTFARDRIYPGLVFERERELWVEFIEGRRAERIDDALIDALAGLLCVLMKRAPRRVPLRDAPWLANAEADLAFLARVGVLPESDAQRLAANRARARARELWVGYDCTDAILKKLRLGRDGRAARGRRREPRWRRAAPAPARPKRRSAG